MSPIKVLKDLKLLSWSTLLWGWRKGWVNRKDMTDFAISLLANPIAGEYSDKRAEKGLELIASGDFLEEDLPRLVSQQVIQINQDANTEIESDKWRLANLICLAESDRDIRSTLDMLQDIYVHFDCPKDMSACSLYSPEIIDPLEAMILVIDQLKRRLLTG